MKLFLIVADYSYHNEKQEAEWLHVVADEPDYDTFEDLIGDHLATEVDRDTVDTEIDSLWINEVKTVDNYKIKLVKE